MDSDYAVLKRRYEAIINGDPLLYTTLKYPGHCVSGIPVYSRYYFECNGVVFLDGNGVCGVGHYDLREKNPKEYLDELIEDLSAKTVLKTLTSVVIGGDPKHFKLILEWLDSKHIPIIGQYLDGAEYCIADFPGVDDLLKSLLVLPSTQEVILFSRKSGFMQLVPTT